MITRLVWTKLNHSLTAHLPGERSPAAASSKFSNEVMCLGIGNPPKLSGMHGSSCCGTQTISLWTISHQTSTFLPTMGQIICNYLCCGSTGGSLLHTVDSRYLAPVGSQNSRARVKWFSRYLALSREGHNSRIQDHRPTLPGVYNSHTVCWAIIEVLTFPGSLHTSTSHQRQITTSNIRF